MNELLDDAMRRRFVRRHVGLNASREDNATWVKLESILDGFEAFHAGYPVTVSPVLV